MHLLKQNLKNNLILNFFNNNKFFFFFLISKRVNIINKQGCYTSRYTGHIQMILRHNHKGIGQPKNNHFLPHQEPTQSTKSMRDSQTTSLYMLTPRQKIFLFFDRYPKTKDYYGVIVSMLEPAAPHCPTLFGFFLPNCPKNAKWGHSPNLLTFPSYKGTMTPQKSAPY